MSAPVAATVFAVTLAFMLLFPFVRISLEGSGEPATLLFLTKTDFGLNIFALILLLMPVAGIAASLSLRENTALLADAAFAVIGVIMIPLVIFTVGHAAGGNALLSSHVAPGVGMIIVAVMMIVLAVSSCIAVFQTRRNGRA
ncbi:MAG TPA: hypothetical protein VIG47_06380 [Gemmatimonadaceae bacterium]